MTDIAHGYTGRDFADLTDSATVHAIGNARAVSTEGPMPLFRPLPAAPAYPVEALGPILAPAAKAIAGQAQCAIACAANSVLAVASLAAQGRANAILPIGKSGARCNGDTCSAWLGGRYAR